MNNPFLRESPEAFIDVPDRDQMFMDMLAACIGKCSSLEGRV